MRTESFRGAVCFGVLVTGLPMSSRTLMRSLLTGCRVVRFWKLSGHKSLLFPLHKAEAKKHLLGFAWMEVFHWMFPAPSEVGDL